ncbi:MAG: BrnT family toxin [Desulfohalobiaceae bacterium]|nr:BrnT family toxin [Desulfohalobiaceae bacterium]
MDFEWDPQKSISNAEKHGIDFKTAMVLWEDEHRIEIVSPYPVENRHIVIAKLNNTHWTAVYTYRNNSLRIISVRRARKKERELYEKQ